MIDVPLLARDGTVRGTAFIDDADVALLDHTWRLHSSGYAVRGTTERGRYASLYLHREVLGLAPLDEQVADHISRDKLDCRRSNLRVLPSRAQNNQNTPGKTNGTSRHRGVCWNTRYGAWMAYVHYDGRTRVLGYFADENEAAAVAADARAAHLPFSYEAAIANGVAS